MLLCEGGAETIAGGAAGEARKGKDNESFREQVGRSNGGKKTADPGGSALLTGGGCLLASLRKTTPTPSPFRSPEICEIEIELNRKRNANFRVQGEGDLPPHVKLL